MFDKVSGELGGRPDPGDTEAEHLWPVRRAAQALVLVPETDRSLPMPAPVASCVGAQKLNRLHSASGDHLPGDSFQWQKVVKAAGFCGDALGVSVFERLGRSLTFSIMEKVLVVFHLRKNTFHKTFSTLPPVFNTRFGKIIGQVAMKTRQRNQRGWCP